MRKTLLGIDLSICSLWTIAAYNIQVTLARENMSKPKEAEMLVQKISCFLRCILPKN